MALIEDKLYRRCQVYFNSTKMDMITEEVNIIKIPATECAECHSDPQLVPYCTCMSNANS
jgi:hypothetical protein